VAAIYFSTKKFDDAREWQKKVLVEDPHDAEAAYTVGVIDWTEAHQNALDALMPAGLNDDGEGNSKAPAGLLAAIKAKNSALVEEGLQYLNQALEDRPSYYDAMAYINLVYRRKADLDYDNPALRNEDVSKAREWAHKAMATRKANEQEIAKPNAEQP
jgi:tetratricopeptide (TPR) repeat protein